MTDPAVLARAMDYSDAASACKSCGLSRHHRDQRDCVEELIQAVPYKKLPDLIAYMRDQLADTGWNKR